MLREGDRALGARILVMCYTNHALDQFLGGLTGVTDKLVRVGGRCTVPELDQFSLRAAKERAKREGRGDPGVRRIVGRLHAHREDVEQELQELQGTMAWHRCGVRNHVGALELGSWQCPAQT